VAGRIRKFAQKICGPQVADHWLTVSSLHVLTQQLFVILETNLEFKKETNSKCVKNRDKQKDKSKLSI
jgi:hypothetical protein